MRKWNLTKLRRWLVRIGLVGIILIILPRVITTLAATPHTTTIEDVEHFEVAVVLAAETVNGKPSAVLRDRIQAGVDLYHAGKVDSLLMSGRSPEPAIMRDYATGLGVPEEDILLDNGGVRTYATCYMAVNSFGLEEAILVTQNYHLPRALYLCRSMGMDATGVAAVHGRYWRGSTIVWNVRETLATVLAFKELYIQAPDTSIYTTLAEEAE